MECGTAVRLINEQLVFRPGWKISAECFCHRFEECVKVTFDYPAFETNRDRAEQGYPEANRPHASYSFQVADLDDEGLWRKLLECVADIDSHEARETLRVKPTFWAPFHPHRKDGMQRWGTPDRDLVFGLA
jgi:hypothetical protein